MDKPNINEVLLLGFFEKNDEAQDASEMFNGKEHLFHTHYTEFVLPLQNVDINEKSDTYAVVLLNHTTPELREYLRTHTEFTNVFVVVCTDARIEHALDRCDMGAFRLRIKVHFPTVTLHPNNQLAIESHKPEDSDKPNLHTMYTLPDREAWW